VVTKTKIIRVSDELARVLDNMAKKNHIKRVDASRVAARMIKEIKNRRLEIKF
jgi:predicted transcriptional regulator